MEIELNRFTPAEQATFRLRALYEQAGYRKYRASRFEEYALYQEYQRFLPDAQVITFTDLDGKLRAIKPDVTLSIAKTAQPAAGECKRFYYNEEVCRPSRESHTFQTIHQMGLESMGAVDADEQAAVVRLALQSLAALDVPTVLEISHMGYLTGLLDALHVPAEARAKLLDFLRAKNAHELRTAALAAGLQTAGAQLPEKINALLEPLFLPLVQALLFVLLCMIVRWVFALLVRLLRGVNLIPLVGGANRLLGLVLGLVTGAFDCWLLALLLWFAASITTGQIDWLTTGVLQRSVGYSLFGAFNPFLLHY